MLATGMGITTGNVFFLDPVNGLDVNDGTSPANAVKTLAVGYALLTSGKTQEALALHQELIGLLDLAFAETNPGPMKSVWDLVGVQAPHLLAPLVDCNPDLSARLREALTVRLQAERQLA
jgi:4-hydroxy-tetrahydrodipicolinate synthase